MGIGLISVVIPTYNYARFAPQAVASVLTQTYRAAEVIVVDDGSTDDTRDRLGPYMDRIRYVYQDNQGLSAARNAGIRAARGEWVALLDSDDVWHPGKLAAQAAHLERHPEVGLLASGAITGPQVPGEWPEVPTAPGTRRISWEELVIRSRFGPSGVVVRRSCFDAVGPFDAMLRSAEDRDMWIRIARSFPVVLLAPPLWFYRTHGGSMSSMAERMEANELRMLENAFRDGSPRPLRWKALSYANYSASHRYLVAGLHARSLLRMLRSFLLWPAPYRRDEVSSACARPKIAAVTLGRWFRSATGSRPPRVEADADGPGPAR